MKEFKTTVSQDTAWSMYLRILLSFIVASNDMTRSDVEEQVRQYERLKKEDSTEKQLSGRTRAFLVNLFGKTILDWPTFSIVMKCFRTKRLALTITLYDADDKAQSYTIETKKDETP